MNPLVRHTLGLSLTLVLVGLCVSPAIAQEGEGGASRARDCAPEERLRFRGGTARLENDVFSGTDSNYTSGVALALISHDIRGRLRVECLPTPVRLHAQLIKFVNPGFWDDAGNPAHSQNVAARIGQSIYTPEDLSRTDLIDDERPYAGLLYVGLSWNRRRHEPESNREVLDTREMTLGVIGPLSFAEESQTLVHDAIGLAKAYGWRHQLKSEPAFQVAMDRKFKPYRGTGAVTPGLSADMIHSLGLRLGNIETSATLGIEGRVGWNVPNDFGSYPIRPGAENRPPSAAGVYGESSDPVPTVGRPRPGMHLFGTAEAKFVAYDFSLDGNLFRSSHSVKRRPWVAQAAAGISAHGRLAGHNVRLAMMRIYRSREFEGQGSTHVFGSIAVSVDF